MSDLDELVRSDRWRRSTAVIAIAATVVATAIVMALFHPRTPSEVNPGPITTTVVGNR